mmetsp:Transcript_16259/g.41260  ORF Transcript_16259/g.41260 Transcript_16259/m.41260 type:complete len:235 (+) Transcript_16259:2257-2961(+)
MRERRSNTRRSNLVRLFFRGFLAIVLHSSPKEPASDGEVKVVVVLACVNDISVHIVTWRWKCVRIGGVRAGRTLAGNVRVRGVCARGVRVRDIRARSVRGVRLVIRLRGRRSVLHRSCSSGRLTRIARVIGPVNLFRSRIPHIVDCLGECQNVGCISKRQLVILDKVIRAHFIDQPLKLDRVLQVALEAAPGNARLQPVDVVHERQLGRTPRGKQHDGGASSLQSIVHRLQPFR